MAIATETARATAEIQAIIDKHLDALRSKQVETLLDDLDPDIVMYDALPPLQGAGKEKSRQKSEQWFGGYDGPISIETRDQHIVAGENVAFGWYLYRVRGTMTSGDTVDMWLRMTTGFRKVDGRWRIVHEHTSVPFDAETTKATLDITP